MNSNTRISDVLMAPSISIKLSRIIVVISLPLFHPNQLRIHALTILLQADITNLDRFNTTVLAVFVNKEIVALED